MARPRSDISERILAAARRRFLAQGVDGASLRAIAKDARTSVGMVSYYFPTKDELFLAVLEHIYPKLLAELRAVLEAQGPLQARVERAYTRLHGLSEEEFAVVRIMLREAMVSSARLEKLVARFTAQGGHVPLALTALEQGMRTDQVRDDVPLLALLVTTIALGMAPVVGRRLLAGLGSEFPPAERVAHVMSTLLFEGVGAHPERRPPQGHSG